MKRLAWIVAVALATIAIGASAQQMQLFRIGTGGTTGTYYPLAGLIANAVSSPPGSRPCDTGGSCGVPGLIATAVSTNGSVDNINGIARGSLESAFTQSDVAYWAHTGTGIYEGKPRVDSLRAVANLYPESVHLVVRKSGGIRSVADLKGKRVSLDEPGSGTLVDARLILDAFGVSEKDIAAEYLKPQQAVDRMKDGMLDAFFNVSGYPQSAIAELAATGAIELIPIDGPEADRMLGRYSFFGRDAIPGDTYRGIAGVKTLSINAIWVTSSKQPDARIYGIVQALWNDSTRKLLDSGHAKGREVKLSTALSGVGIPLHPGAEKFYREKGVLK